MNLAVGCRFDYVAAGETPTVVLVEPHSSMAGKVVEEHWEGDAELERYEDMYGNSCRRLVLPQGASSIAYHAVVRGDPEPERMPSADDAQIRIEDLPDSLLHWLLPSRLCQSDLFVERAWELFGEVPADGQRVQRICDWIHDSIEYGVESVPTTTAADTLERAGGMCRDLAHVGVTFCRALGIPARYVFGYMPDIGIEGPFPTMDFHAWFEVWLGGSWWTYDARFNVPRIGRVPIGRGRDAVDVAMVTTFGDARLEAIAVWADEVGAADSSLPVTHGR